MIKRLLTAALVLLLVAATAPLKAQSLDINFQDIHFSNPAVRIGQDFALKQGDAAREVLVIGGDATIDGTVDRDVVVILGKVQVAGSASVHGSMIVVGGSASVGEGAHVDEDLVVIGGYEPAAGFSPGGHQVVIGTAGLGAGMRGLVPWLTRGFLLGRLIVPDLGWVWTVAALFFLVNLLLNLVFDTPIRASAVSLRATPLTAFVTGLLVMLLAGPICFLLAVSVVGIAVIPFLLFALLIAVVLGKIAFARWIGMRVVAEDDPDNRMQTMRSFLIGSVIMALAYMVPVLGLITWSMAGVFGLGAATLAFFTAYRRENPKKPKPVRPAPEAPPAAEPAPATYASAVAPGDTGLAGDVPAPVLQASAVSSPIAQEPLIPAAPAPAGGLLSMTRATFVERLAAFALDFILVVIITQAFDLDRVHDAPLGRVGILLAIAYHVGFWTWKGTTLGGIICNLRVIRTDGRRLEFAEALVRGLTGIFSLAVVGIGFLWILRDPERQAWHDRVAGTYVVKVPRDYPI